MTGRAQTSMLVRAAKAERRRIVHARLSRWHRFVLLHPAGRHLPRFVRARSFALAERLYLEVEDQLPRRYRRALRGTAMRPAKGTR